MLDHWLSICIFTPIIVAYWRGTWQLLDLYLWPESERCLNSLTSFTIGVGTITVLCMAQTQITKNITTARLGKATFFIISRFYTVLFAFVGVNHWRGVWIIMECQVGMEWWSTGFAVAVAAITLACLRTLKTVLAPPFSVCVDDELDYFKVPTLFKTKANRITCVFIVDVLISVVVVGSLVVVVWWGVWTLFDIILFPDSLLWSAMTCVFLGIFVAVLCFISQTLAAYCSRNSPYWLRIILEDIFLFIAEVGAISLWRGIWYLLDIFFIPDDPYLSNAVTSFTGISLLIMMYNSNSILVKGILFNLHLKDGSGCLFQISYIDKIRATIGLCNAAKPNKMNKHKAHKEPGKLQNYNWNESDQFTNYETTEPLWIPQVIIANGKQPIISYFDRETVL